MLNVAEDSTIMNESHQVCLVSAEEAFSIPKHSLTVTGSLQPYVLEQLLHPLLQKEHPDLYQSEQWNKKKFHFLALGDLIKGDLHQPMQSKDTQTRGPALEITFFEGLEPPELQSCSSQEDWVAGVHVMGAYALTACYDNTVNIFDLEGNKKLTIPSHSGPARDVVWISMDEEKATFASGGHDQLVILYKWNLSSNAIEVMNHCNGHGRSVECLSVSPDLSKIASGSFDTNVMIWRADLTVDNPAEDSGQPSVTRNPVATLGGHKEAVSGLGWMSEGELVSASWDHSVKIWDVEAHSIKSEYHANKSFFDLSYSDRNQTILTASADSSIHLYDPRSKDGFSLKSQHRSHKGWVTGVSWCKTKEHLFASSGHDNWVKVWDSRSRNTPIYDLKSHNDKILCCDWSEPSIIASGGTDDCLKLFRTGY